MPRHRTFPGSWRFAIFCAALLLARGDAGRALANMGWRTDGPGPEAGRQVEAARLMARSLDCIRRARLSRGLPIDGAADPNQTGIVGDEFTSLTTSLGDVEGKRTSASPAFAAAIVNYFLEAELGRGDVVAVGASGSFPAFLLATLSASRVLGLEPIVVYSVGASMYGANLPGFTFVEMLDALRTEGLLPYGIAGISPGGREDGGGGVLFEEEGRTLVDEARRSGLPLVGGRSLAESIGHRLRIYEQKAAGRPIRCFVNVGGASANYGDTEASLALPPGLLTRLPGAVPAASTRGLVFEFGARGIPVVHLLYVKGLARLNGLPFDPVPFPPIGEGDVYRGPTGKEK